MYGNLMSDTVISVKLFTKHSQSAKLTISDQKFNWTNFRDVALVVVYGRTFILLASVFKSIFANSLFVKYKFSREF